MHTKQQEKEIIKGKLTMLIPLAEYDLGKFIELHRADKGQNMGRFCLKDYTQEQALVYITNLIKAAQLFIWNVYTIEDEPRFGGFIYLTDVNNYMASVSGIMDKMFAKTMPRHSDSASYTEDALRTMLAYCFHKGVNRVETDVCQSNKVALALDKKVGFVKEGVLRNVIIKDKGFDNLVILSILKEEHERGKI